MRDDLADFVVSRTADVARLLAQLRDTATPLVLAAPSGVSLTARLWSANSAGGRLQFAVDTEAPQLQPLLAADEALAVGYQDNIQLQFSLHGLVLVRGPSAATLQTGWPESVLRLQRRDSYRVRMGSSLAPTLVLRHPSLPEMTLSLRVLDLSAGGCALLLPRDVPELQPGSRLHKVAVELDIETRFETSLLLHHISAFDGEDGPRRIGCSWTDLSPSAERALQRYILQTQKRQRLRPLPA